MIIDESNNDNSKSLNPENNNEGGDQNNEDMEESEDDQEEGHYEVESLAKIRKTGTKHPNRINAHQYELLVHWKGYSDITWEPLENLVCDVPDMVDDFVQQRFGIEMAKVQKCKYRGETYYVVPDAACNLTA